MNKLPNNIKRSNPIKLENINNQKKSRLINKLPNVKNDKNDKNYISPTSIDIYMNLKKKKKDSSKLVDTLVENFNATDFFELCDINDNFLKLYSKRILKMSSLTHHSIQARVHQYTSDINKTKLTKNSKEEKTGDNINLGK